MKNNININQIREKFPVVNNLIYFDHAAVAPIHIDSCNEIKEYLEYILQYGDKNYSIWHEKVETIRTGLAEFINASVEEIAFVNNTSHGISIVANGLNWNNGDNVVIPEIEFPANIYPWMNLNRFGVRTRFIEAEEGEIPLENIERAIDEKTRVVSISSVEYSTGYRNNLKAIGELCKKKSEQYNKKIYFCVDAIQSLGAFKIDVKECYIDFLSADGHKWFLTPESAGIFYCKNDNLKDLYPTSVGWKSVKNPTNFSQIKFELQETAKKYEEGSLNIAGIIALGASLKLFNSVGMDYVESRILELNQFAVNNLTQNGYIIKSTQQDPHRSGIIVFNIDGNIEEVYKNLLKNNVQVSMRSGNIRLSIHFYNTKEEILRFIDILNRS